MHLLMFYIIIINFLSTELMIHIFLEHIDPDCKFVFRENDNFKVNQLIKIFEDFEQLCFKTNVNNITTISQRNIPDVSLIKILEVTKDLTGFVIINKVNLSTATRRFITRRLRNWS